MSYVENNEEQIKTQIKNGKNQKTKGLVRTILSEDTIVESPEDIIDRDPDVERRNAFKRAYEILLALFPETVKKRKTRKEKEKEEFDKSISYYRQNQIQKEKQKEEEKEIEKDNGIERGE